MSQTISSPVTSLLKTFNIPFDIIEIPLSDDKKPIRNLEDLLVAQGRDPLSVIRSLLFKTSTDNYVLLAVAGGGRADWAILREHLNERKLRMAEYDEVEQATGYVVGAVPPIALPETIHVLIDKTVADYDNIIIGSGVLGYAISLSNADLQTVMANADMGAFIKTEAGNN